MGITSAATDRGFPEPRSKIVAAPAIFLKNIVGWEKYMQKIDRARKTTIRRKQNWDSVNPQGGFASTL